MLYNLKPIAIKICKEIFTANNLNIIRNNKILRNGCVDITEYFNTFLPENSYIYFYLNILNKKRNHSCFFDKTANGATIELNIWRKEFLKTKLKEMKIYIINVLIHEFCHAVDRLNSNGKANVKYNKTSKKINIKDYVLEPMEINAYIHEIASLKKIYKKVKTLNDFINIITDNISALFEAKFILSEKEWNKIINVYLKRLAREKLLPKALTKN